MTRLRAGSRAAIRAALGRRAETDQRPRAIGRQWVSPPGNLYASLLLIDPAPPPLSAQLGFVAGIALIGALRQIIGGDAPVKLKWPNDVLCGGAKLSGLLLEGASLSNGLFGCVVGFGVNCLSSPTDAPYPTASLKSIGAESCDRAALFAALSDHLVEALELWARGAKFCRRPRSLAGKRWRHRRSCPRCAGRRDPRRALSWH